MSHQSSFNLQQTNYQMNNSQLPPVPPPAQQAYQRPMFYIDQEQNASNNTNTSTTSQTQQNFNSQDENEAKRLVNTVTYLNSGASQESKSASYGQRKPSETVSEIDHETKHHRKINTEPEM